VSDDRWVVDDERWTTPTDAPPAEPELVRAVHLALRAWGGEWWCGNDQEPDVCEHHARSLAAALAEVWREAVPEHYAGDQVQWCASCQRWHGFGDATCVDVPADWPRESPAGDET
jgi:hypothetical protein